MSQKRSIVRSSGRSLLAALVLGFLTPLAGAQGIGSLGGGGGGAGGGGGGAGGGGSTGSATSLGGQGSVVGTVTSIGSGPISAFNNNGTGLSSLTNTSGGGKGGATTGTNAIPSQNDPFNTYYTNAYQAGIITGTTGGTTTGVFGQATYAAMTAPTATAAPASNVQPYVASTANGFTSVGVRRAPTYITTAGDDLPLIRHNPGTLQVDLQKIVLRSGSLKRKDDIRIEVLEGGIVRLSGTVENAHDQRLAESLMRMTPGVQGVLNNLQINQLARVN